MEEKKNKKFVCKFCNKRYPCGKALGGHIRTHMNQNSAQVEQEAQVNANVVRFPSVDGGIRSKKDSGSEAAAWNSVYGLRENPKKTWRISDSGDCLLQERVCKECGKGFQSLKALCGHMACHSDKEKLISKFEEKPVMMDSHSVNETSAQKQLRRSKRTRYQTLDVFSSANTLPNGSSSVSEIEQEQEEGAMCLMMLSRDSGHRGGLNSVADSSDNDSVVLEPMTMKNGRNYVSNTNEFVKLKRQRDKKLKTAVTSLSDNSDSGCFRNETNKAEGDVSVDGSFTGDGFKKPKVEYGSGIGGFDAELGESSNRFKYVVSELGKELIINAGYDHVGRALMEYDSGMRAKNDSYSREFLEGSNTKIKISASSNIESCKNAQKRSKYECSNCKMCFQSHRALGGHRASHTKSIRCCESMYESGENNIHTDSLPVTKPYGKAVKSCSVKTSINQSISAHSEKKLGPKKSKGHECPICFRVFRSGQALGGHKRSHFFGGSEETTVVIKQELPEFPGLIDLNLPAPMEEEANGHAEFMPC
ncbi:uncharacterized protein LOC132179443 [Corylus avellana]|uniref:uncharacterized protein LOC132179443 n=1 Tax=Corylus avellana TaxID=13451 RepID=UPI00286D02A1|nr:uncharacterized protein LOC132179443 [Corylus avellana]